MPQEIMFHRSNPYYPLFIKWMRIEGIHPEDVHRVGLIQYTDKGSRPPYIVIRLYGPEFYCVGELSPLKEHDKELILFWQAHELDEVTVSLREGRYQFEDRYLKPLELIE
jgi:hypothetical protein